jgi:hypothetical protein
LEQAIVWSSSAFLALRGRGLFEGSAYFGTDKRSGQSILLYNRTDKRFYLMCAKISAARVPQLQRLKSTVGAEYEPVPNGPALA